MNNKPPDFAEPDSRNGQQCIECGKPVYKCGKRWLTLIANAGKDHDHNPGPSPQDTYKTLMGASAATWSWWKRWNDPVDWDNIPDDWKVTGRIENPNEGGSIEFELNHAKLLAAVRAIAAMTGINEYLLDNCKLLLTDPEDADFDAGSADAVCQWALFGDFVYC